MLAIENIIAGDLLTVQSWECEGVERPWGFHLDVLEGLTELSGVQFRRLTRRASSRVVLTPGETCIALQLRLQEHPTVDTFCEVLIRGTKLGVHTRFLHPVL
jgi:hypothetical protein